MPAAKLIRLGATLESYFTKPMLYSESQIGSIASEWLAKFSDAPYNRTSQDIHFEHGDHLFGFSLLLTFFNGLVSLRLNSGSQVFGFEGAQNEADVQIVRKILLDASGLLPLEVSRTTINANVEYDLGTTTEFENWFNSILPNRPKGTVGLFLQDESQTFLFHRSHESKGITGRWMDVIPGALNAESLKSAEDRFTNLIQGIQLK